MSVRFKFFRSSTRTWEDLFAIASAFASRLPTDRLVNISHSCDENDGVVTVWYWATDEENTAWTV